MRARPGVEGDVGDARPVGWRAGVEGVREDVRWRPRPRCGSSRATVAVSASSHDLDARVERQLRLPPQVLERPRQLPRIALGTQVVGEGRIDDHHDAVVGRHGRPRPRRRLDLHLVRGELVAGEADPAIGQVLDRVGAGRGHDRGDDGSLATLAQDRQQHLDPPLDQVRAIADEGHGADVQVVGQEVEQCRLVGRDRCRHHRGGRRAAPATAAPAAGGP